MPGAGVSPGIHHGMMFPPDELGELLPVELPAAPGAAPAAGGALGAAGVPPPTSNDQYVPSFCLAAR